MKINKYKIYGKIVYNIIKLRAVFMSKKTLTAEDYDASGQYVYVFWHRQIYSAAFATRIVSHKAGLVSPSKDGDMLAELLKGEGNLVIRGSSNKDGIKSLKEILKLIKQKYNVGIAVDGPKGPIFEPKEGAAFIAQKSKLKVVAVGGYCNKKHILKKHWDRMEIPKLFSKNIYYMSSPFEIPTDYTLQEATQKIKNKLHETNIIAYNKHIESIKK